MNGFIEGVHAGLAILGVLTVLGIFVLIVGGIMMLIAYREMKGR